MAGARSEEAGPVELTPEWQKLTALADGEQQPPAEALADEARCDRLRVDACGIHADLTRQRFGITELDLLLELIEARGVPHARDAMFSGDNVNTTEDRPALHTALRLPAGTSLEVDGVDVAAEVHEVLDSMSAFSTAVRSGERTGHTGKRLTTIINIGIGGSNLGPRMAVAALRPFVDDELDVRFVSNVDPADLNAALAGADPQTTLIVVCSKTFTTLETITNATAAREWLLAGLGGDTAAVAAHMVAVSTASEEVAAFGIDPDSGMFGFWDWVGGRYSVDSAIGLSLMLAIGPESFGEFLAGMHEVDEHFKSAPLERNLPVLMAAAWLWNGNFAGHATVAVLPYSSDMHLFTSYLQQLDMESNGKRVRQDGEPVQVDTGPILWGQAGTDGQHAFHQLLHQGTRIVPCDLIGFARAGDPADQDRQDLLAANLIAQAESLSIGRTEAQAAASGRPELAPHRTFPGGRPVTVLFAERLDPATLGRLIALYEHKVFVEATVWGINPFDQWGVELGKEMARVVGPELTDGDAAGSHDPSTSKLIETVRTLRED